MQWGPLVEGTILDADLLHRISVDHRPMAVIHCAALSDAAESVKQPDRYWRVNVAGTQSLQSVFGHLPWVFSSSAAVYGNADGLITEDRLPVPLNPYGKSKLECECMLFSTVMKLRYFNVAGCDPSIGIGAQPKTHLIPRVLQAARDGGVFEIYGDGDAVRDFVDARDVAHANVLALKLMLNGAKGIALNICGGYEHSILDVVRTVTNVTKRKIKTRCGPNRDGDPVKVVGRHERATEAIGWRPRYTLEEQIVSMWESMNMTKAAA